MLKRPRQNVYAKLEIANKYLQIELINLPGL